MGTHYCVVKDNGDGTYDVEVFRTKDDSFMASFQGCDEERKDEIVENWS